MVVGKNLYHLLEKRVNTRNAEIVLHINSFVHSKSDYFVRLIANVANDIAILAIGVQKV